MRLKGYPGNEVWAGALDFEDRDVKPALGLIHAHCVYWMELLTRFSNSWDHAIIVTDDVTGSENPMTVLQLVQMLVEHMEEHLDQIAAIKEFNRI